MAQIFISYRHEDSRGETGRLAKDLKGHLGEGQIFRDIDAIEAGLDFVEEINSAFDSCKAVLAIIGPNWLSAKDKDGHPRLDDPQDTVRLEIEAALSRDIRLIPVLVGGAPMPRETDLRDSLSPLARRQKHELSESRWDFDVARLAAILLPLLHAEKSQTPQEGPTVKAPADSEESIQELIEPQPPSEGELKSSLESLKALLEKAQREQFTFLLMGRTGVGKSSTVNTLMGEQIAKVGEFKPTTIGVKPYKSEIQGVRYVVFDTPGLCDDLPSKGNDDLYLKKIKTKVSEIDSLWFVTPLDDRRVGGDEKRGIQLITKALGKKIWERAVIVFTFADRVSPEEYEKYLTERRKVIRAEIAVRAGDAVARRIEAVAVSNVSPCTPDGQAWLGELFAQIVGRISKRGVLPFVIALADRVEHPFQKNKKDDEPTRRIRLSDSQRARVKERTADVVKAESKSSTLSMAAAGAGVGAYLGGPAGALFGGATGAALGLLSSLWKK